MAELFGTLASAVGVVGVAAQCADGIRKLREFQKDVKNAPEEIGILIEQLDVLSQTVGSIGFQIQRSVQNVGAMDMTGPLRRCCNSVASTAAIVRDLNAEIGVKRRRGALKAAWKKKEIEEFMGRVERCKTSLALAYSAFARESQHQEFTMITGRLDQMQNTVVTFTQISSVTRMPPPPTQGSLQITAPGDMLKQKQEKRNAPHEILMRQDSHWKRRPPIRVAMLLFPLPHWLISRSLEIEVLRSTRGWSFNLNPQRTVPGHSDLFHGCKYDNLTTVRNLVAEGKASIQDVYPAGWSVPDVLLFRMGLNVDSEEHLKMLEFAMENGAISTKHTRIPRYTWASNHDTRLDDVMSTVLHKVVDKFKADMSVERLDQAIQTQGKISGQVVFSVFDTFVQSKDLPLATRSEALSLDLATSTSPIDLEAWIDIESFGKTKTDCSPKLYQRLIELLGRSIGGSLARRDEDGIKRWHGFIARVLEQCNDKLEILDSAGSEAFRYYVGDLHYRDCREVSDNHQMTPKSIQEFAEEFCRLSAELISFGDCCEKYSSRILQGGQMVLRIGGARLIGLCLSALSLWKLVQSWRLENMVVTCSR